MRLFAILILAFLLMQLSIPISGASGHGVKSNLLPGPIRVQEVFSSSEAAVGEVVTVSVTLTNLSENNFTASAGIFDEDSSSLHITSISPDGAVDLGPGAVIDFDINARAVRPGIFHVHTSFQIEGLGNVLGPGQTITVYPEEVTVTTVEVNDKKVDVSFFLEEPIKIERAWVDKDTRSLLISLSGGSWDGSKMMTIWVPTDLIHGDSYGAESATYEPMDISVDGIQATASRPLVSETREAYVLDLKEGSSIVRIQGSYIAPEFGTLAGLVMAVAILGTIIYSTIVSSKLRKREMT